MTTTEEVPMPEPAAKRSTTADGKVLCEPVYTPDQLCAYADARCAKLQAQCDALAEKVKAMEDNDRRYRWLRDKANDANRSAPMVVSHPLDHSLQTLLHGEHLDAAIDAAGGGESC